MTKSEYLNQKPDDPAKPYVFISYARGDAPEDTRAAEQIEEALVAAGINCFRDVHMTRGDHGGWTISEELGKCNLMVLVVSPRSMDEKRREVTDEWYSFVRKKKKILPFKVDETELPHNLAGLNFINATNDREQALKDLLEAIQTGASSTFEKRSNPALNAYRQSRIDLWSKPEYQLDKRFVNLTLSIDIREQESKQQKVETFRSQDLRVILDKTPDSPVLVLLGKPGSGKSTLLRHLEMDLCADQMRDDSDLVTFFIQLNEYIPGKDPRQWLIERWAAQPFKIGSLDAYLNQHRVLLLLDAFNEIPHGSTTEYDQLANVWGIFAQETTGYGNRIIFSCRERDYDGCLSDTRVEVQPLDPPQVRVFLDKYLPDQQEKVWNKINDPRHFDLYRTPFFLKLLCQVADKTGNVPLGRAGLLTSYLRLLLQRESKRDLFRQEWVLTKFDRQRIALKDKDWPGLFTLPNEGQLIPGLSRLAFAMQLKGKGPERSQVRITNAEAARMVEYPEKPQDILDAGFSLNVLDIDPKKEPPVAFNHQLLQEYFAARRLANEPQPELAHQEWRREQVDPSYEEVIKGKEGWEPVPPLRQTGWEETILIAAPMAEDPNRFIRELIPYNLPLAARCAASAELVKVDEQQQEALRRELRDKLLRRMRDPEADLRARLAAGEALGEIGHPEFELRKGKFGDFLLPPFESVPAGIYPFGEKNQPVELGGFQMGRYPVTNAEFAHFIEAGGYHNFQWWDSSAASDWLKRYAYRLPEYWNNTLFNNPAQPVVGVTWYEARAYCKWLTASLGSLSGDGADRDFHSQIFRLPTEPEFEAAARGIDGLSYPYGNDCNLQFSNTQESCIGRPSPVGLFENRSPFGIYDLSGNVWEWCLNEFEKPLEDPTKVGLGGTPRRPLRGGSWDYNVGYSRTVYRFSDGATYDRVNFFGFRLVGVSLSLKHYA